VIRAAFMFDRLSTVRGEEIPGPGIAVVFVGLSAVIHGPDLSGLKRFPIVAGWAPARPFLQIVALHGNCPLCVGQMRPPSSGRSLIRSARMELTALSWCLEDTIQRSCADDCDWDLSERQRIFTGSPW